MKYFRATWRISLFFGLSIGIYLLWLAGWVFIPNRLYWRQILFNIWATVFARIARMEIKVIGTPPRAPFFLVSNHLGYVDIPLLRAIVDGVFVARADLKKWFLAGRIIGSFGTIFVDRENKRDIPRAGLDILSALERGEGVIVFPEGTSGKGEEVMPFKSSFFEFAAQTDLPVYYASINYQTPINEIEPSTSVCWWDDTAFLIHLWRFFQLTEVTALVTFGESPLQSVSRKELALRLHHAVAEKFIPII